MKRRVWVFAVAGMLGAWSCGGGTPASVSSDVPADTDTGDGQGKDAGAVPDVAAEVAPDRVADLVPDTAADLVPDTAADGIHAEAGPDQAGCEPGTACFVENEFGKCLGKLVCVAGAPPECDAATPAQELCDGEDNDCDGQMDNASCDDGNDCTQDTCLGEAGCLNEPLAGTDCDDADACTGGDHCQEGACTGTPIGCEDDDPCTDDTCDPVEGCVYSHNQADCDDGDPCTVADGCHQGWCWGYPVACECWDDEDCFPLEDGDVCNGTLLCDLSKLPHLCAVDQVTVIDCPAAEGLGAECLAPACDEATGKCSLVPAAEGKACDDGDACTLGDKCGDGACAGIVPLNCIDGNPCTNDACDAGTGCTHMPNSNPCSDGDACSTGDQCADGFCMSGVPAVCDDGNGCTDDACDSAKGCLFTPNAAACDDGNACTAGDQCANGYCAGKQMVACDDGNLCTDDWCDPTTGCKHQFNAAPCDDGSACTDGDACANGECDAGKPIKCDDGNGCTADACAADKGCTFVPAAGVCDDGNACTTGDYCAQGKCTAKGALDCDDDNPCTKDSCSPGPGCQHEDLAIPCSDGDLCTVGDACKGGECQPGSPLNCDDENLCTDDACDPKKGCVFLPNAAACDDGNACTAGDACVQGACKGPQAVDCNDGNLCTTDLCDPAEGCQNPPNTNPCDDGDCCTAGDICALGACAGGPAVTCDDGNPCTDDTCQPDKGCAFTPNTVQCDDGNACTTEDQCKNGFCFAAKMVPCDDGNVCTDDGCDPLSGCTHADNTAECDDHDECTLLDTCALGACVGVGAPECKDGDKCTQDACDPLKGCVFSPIIPCCGDGQVHAPEECDKGSANGSVGLGACSADCKNTSAFELVLRMNGSGQVLAGAWDKAWDRVVNQGQDCLVRFDSRLARPLHVEYEAASLRFDFQPLHAFHDGWDSYGYVEVRPGVRAGVGAAYRRGHHSYVLLKDAQQHAEANWVAAQVELYCERASQYELSSTFDANGNVTSGASFDTLYDQVAQKAALCKVRYDSRISTAWHVEYETGQIYFDFLGLHATHNAWDSYAFVAIQKGVRAALAASYRRGHADMVHLRDRQQHSEFSTTKMPVDVFCRKTPQEQFTVASNGQMVKGTWTDLHMRVVEEARECRVRFDNRVATPAYIEYQPAELIFEFENLHAPHDTWESLAHVYVGQNSKASLRSLYRRGHANNVYLKTVQQHPVQKDLPMVVDVFCDATVAPVKVYAASAVGNDVLGAWKDFYGPLVNPDQAYQCAIRVDGRITTPLSIEHAGENAEMYFDYVSFSAWHDSWDSYAAVLVQPGIKAGLLSSYRRGHDDIVWKKDRDQHPIVQFVSKELEFFCR